MKSIQAVSHMNSPMLITNNYAALNTGKGVGAFNTKTQQLLNLSIILSI